MSTPGVIVIIIVVRRAWSAPSWIIIVVVVVVIASATTEVIIAIGVIFTRRHRQGHDTGFLMSVDIRRTRCNYWLLSGGLSEVLRVWRTVSMTSTCGHLHHPMFMRRFRIRSKRRLRGRHWLWTSHWRGQMNDDWTRPRR
ncbi:hypothetical protein EDD16DRAFT_1620343 [Pisolithus croceorrhizus]|nr:hypothetical protein EDD16DRAFT_1620343 [Pisolithus croceorrhizus]KAI6124117.1 hypothetical protein EV401DRAFT_1944323 [Pisolithus croceorrhizus]